MKDIESLMKRLSTGERRAVEEYQAAGYDDLADLLESGDWSDAVHDWADSQVSVYTRDRLAWLLEHWPTADTAEAIRNGAKTADEAAAWCWYEAEYQRLDHALTALKDIWDEAGAISRPCRESAEAAA